MSIRVITNDLRVFCILIEHSKLQFRNPLFSSALAHGFTPSWARAPESWRNLATHRRPVRKRRGVWRTTHVLSRYFELFAMIFPFRNSFWYMFNFVNYSRDARIVSIQWKISLTNCVADAHYIIYWLISNIFVSSWHNTMIDDDTSSAVRVNTIIKGLMWTVM